MIDLEDRSIIISMSCIARNYHVFGTIPLNIVKKKVNNINMELKNTWRQYFITHKDNAVLDRNQSALKSTWSTDSTLDYRLALFGANSDIVIMMLSPIGNKMKMIHSVTNIGGSLMTTIY